MIWLFVIPSVVVLAGVLVYLRGRRRPAVWSASAVEPTASSSWPKDIALPGQPVSRPALAFDVWHEPSGGPWDQPSA